MLLALLLLPSAEAKDLRSKVGLGFHQAIGPDNLTALSVRYGFPAAKPVTNIQLEADVGLALAAETPASFYAGGRLLYTVVAEDNLNLYLGAGAGYANQVVPPADADSDPTSAGFVRIQPAVGAEFFLFGLENLGFSVEWGVNVDLGSTWSVQTVGSAPAAAVHYYF